MTFFEKYHEEKSWAKRVMIMEIYHLARKSADKKWTVTMTARDFACSIGLVSENLKLARAIHRNEKVMHYPTRETALRKI